MDADDYIKIIAAVGGIGWIGNSIIQYIKSKSDVDIKKYEYSTTNNSDKAKVTELEKVIETLNDAAVKLNAEIDSFKELAQVENEARMRSEQQLATINIAFDIIYVQLQRILGADEQHAELLNQLKKYIDDGTRNMGT